MDKKNHYADKVYRRIIECPFATRSPLLDGTNNNMALKMKFLSSVEMFFTNVLTFQPMISVFIVYYCGRVY